MIEAIYFSVAGLMSVGLFVVKFKTYHSPITIGDLALCAVLPLIWPFWLLIIIVGLPIALTKFIWQIEIRKAKKFEEAS